MSDQPSLYDGIVTTRAIRRYRDDDIPTDDLNKIMFAATRGPSGHNRQPFRFVVLRRTPDAAAARELLAGAFRDLWSHERWEPDADDDSRRAKFARTMNQFVDGLAQVPVIVLPICRVREGRDRFVEGASVFPACQNLLLAARALGYGGVITQWHGGVHAELAELLDLPDGHQIAAAIPLGRPQGNHGPVRRLPLPDLVYENRFGTPADWAKDPEGTRYTGG